MAYLACALIAPVGYVDVVMAAKRTYDLSVPSVLSEVILTGLFVFKIVE